MESRDYVKLLDAPLGSEADVLRSKMQYVIRGAGLNLVSASKKMGLESFATLNDFYKKDQIPSFTFFDKFCSTFNVSEQWLFDLENNENFMPFEPSVIRAGRHFFSCKDATISIIIFHNYVVVVADKDNNMGVVGRTFDLSSCDADKNINALTELIKVSKKVNLYKASKDFPSFVLGSIPPIGYILRSDCVAKDLLPSNEYLIIQKIKDVLSLEAKEVDEFLVKRFVDSNVYCNSDDKQSEPDIGIHGLYIEEL